MATDNNDRGRSSADDPDNTDASAAFGTAPDAITPDEVVLTSASTSTAASTAAVNDPDDENDIVPSNAPAPKSTARQLWELVATVAIALVIAYLAQAFLVKPYKIPSESMLPTLKVGDRVLVNRVGQQVGSVPKVGDIIVFHPPVGAQQLNCASPMQGLNSAQPCGVAGAAHQDNYFIKRVVAVAGDRLAIRDGHVIRNGRPATEKFILPCASGQIAACDFPSPIRIPAGTVYVMGDNRGNSDDSRFWGPVRTNWIIGEAFLIYWPLDRIGGV